MPFLRPHTILRPVARIPQMQYQALRHNSTAAAQEDVQSALLALKDDKEKIKSAVEEYVKTSPVFIATKSYCSFCARSKTLLNSLGASYQEVELDTLKNGSSIQNVLFDLTTQSTVPNIWIGGKHVGGSSDLSNLSQKGQLKDVLQNAGAIPAAKI